MNYFKLFITTLFLIVPLYAEPFLAKESKQAFKEKKLLLVTVSSERCPYCIKMRKEIFNNPKYKATITQKYVYLEVEYDDILLPASLHVKYLPTNYILSPKNLEILDEFAGYIEPKHFIELLEEVYKQESH